MKEIPTIYLDKNEAPIDLPDSIKKEILNQMSSVGWHRYPSPFCDSLREKIALRHHVTKDQIYLGNGSSNLIMLLLSYFSKDYHQIIYPFPSFEILYLCPEWYNIMGIQWPLSNNMTYNYDTFPRHEKSIYILSSPNNPTGNEIDRLFLENEIQKNPGSLFFIDEAYAEFGTQDLSYLVNKFNNVIILRTLSKAFGLAGIRLGYVVSNTSLMESIQIFKLPFRFNHFTIISASIILDRYDDLIVPRIEKWKKERENFISRISTLFQNQESKIYQSNGNFFMIEMADKQQVEQLITLCQNENLRIGPLSSDDRHFRISVGTHKNNNVFFNILSRVIA